MPRLKFYDVKKRKSFTTDKFKIVSKRNPRTKRTTYFAVSVAPSGVKAYRIVAKDFANKYK